MTDAGPPAAAEASLSPTHVLGATVRRRVIGGIVPVTGDKPDGHCQFMMLLLLLLQQQRQQQQQKAAAAAAAAAATASTTTRQHNDNFITVGPAFPQAQLAAASAAAEASARNACSAPAPHRGAGEKMTKWSKVEKAVKQRSKRAVKAVNRCARRRTCGARRRR